MDELVRKKIQEIIGDMECPYAFRCAEAGFAELCETQDVSLDRYLLCLEEAPQNCKFHLSFGESHFCRCPLRVYLAKELKK
ncbi:hypothetical protein ACFL4G_04080 [Thermodesulfobacteriota bacterium]